VPAVELLRAIGALQELGDGRPITAGDRETLALESGVDIDELWRLIAAGVRAGDIAVDDAQALSLTTQGRAWWRTQYADW
jgi:hypothetical protein